MVLLVAYLNRIIMGFHQLLPAVSKISVRNGKLWRKAGCRYANFRPCVINTKCECKQCYFEGM